MPANGRFELPALTPLNFSLTDGTDIPPPPESPIREEPEPAPVSTIRKVTDEPTTPTTSGTATGAENGHTNEHLSVTTSSEGVYDGRLPTNGSSQTSVSTDNRPPMSPVSVNRPSSIRRFLSRKSLNTNYENGTNTNTSHEDLTKIERPESSMSFAMGGRADKKSRQSWFKRFSSKNKSEEKSKRGSVIYEDMKPQVVAPAPAPVVSRPKGPPAPKLPELNRLNAQTEDLSSLGGGEMFKNIK